MENGDGDMLRMNGMKMGLMVVLAAAGLASAHLVNNDPALKPTAGESVILGSTYKISWTVDIYHANYTNIDLSTDGGSSWTTIKKNFHDAKGVNNFNWTVAGTATENGLIRICQHAVDSNKACLATEKTSVPGSAPNGNYVKITSPFKLKSESTALQTTAGTSSFALDFNSDTRNVNVSFALGESGPVLLQAFDARGRLMANLVERDFPAGEHKLSMVSKGLNAKGGSLLFKLKVGDQVQSQIWTSVR